MSGVVAIALAVRRWLAVAMRKVASMKKYGSDMLMAFCIGVVILLPTASGKRREIRVALCRCGPSKL
eukprot:6204627-Pleurochrysis_carterae.AAC.1